MKVEEEASFCFHVGDGDCACASEITSFDATLANQRKEWLAAIESLIWRALASQGRFEACLWLCASIGSLQVPPHLHSSLFLDLIKRSPHKRKDGFSSQHQDDSLDQALSRQFLRLACENQPRRVMSLFAKDSKLIRSFFSGHPKRILAWFENFSTEHKKGYELGAQALAHFAFIHRDKCWKELEWRGPHGQAPATVASKPFYFLDLDVLRTVENFLHNVLEFWSSDELWGSLKEGEILSIDMEFFIDKLFHRMSDQSSDVWHMLENFLTEETFSDLCQRLLSFLDDKGLLAFLNNLSVALLNSRRVSASEGSKHVKRRGSQLACGVSKWLEDVLISGAKCPSLVCAMICEACVGHARQLLRIFKDEENAQEFNSLKCLLLESDGTEALNGRKHWAIRKEGLKSNRWEMVKWLALEAWSMYFLLTEKYTSPALLEALLSANSIEFRHCSQDLLDKEQGRSKSKTDENARKDRKRKKKKKGTRFDESDREQLDSSQSDDNLRDQKIRKEKKRKKKKKRRDENGGGKFYSSHSDDDSYSMAVVRKRWFLSIDNFNVGFDKSELPEHVASHTFGEWLKWASAHL